MGNILITGVSSGIGLHAARYFLKRDWQVFGSVRNTSDASELSQFESFVPLIFDVREEQAVHEAAKTVKNILKGQTLDVLVNNAGIAIYGPIMHIPVEEFRLQMETNVIGLLHVTQAFLPLLGASQDFEGIPGRIINIGSVSGRFTTPLLGPYCASKHALEAITDAMRRELILYNIQVSNIQAAGVKSEIWEKAKEADSHTVGTIYERIESQKNKLLANAEKNALDTQKMSRLIWQIAQARRPKPRYLLTRNNLLYRLMFAMPDRFFDRIFKKTFKLNGEVESPW